MGMLSVSPGTVTATLRRRWRAPGITRSSGLQPPGEEVGHEGGPCPRRVHDFYRIPGLFYEPVVLAGEGAPNLSPQERRYLLAEFVVAKMFHSTNSVALVRLGHRQIELGYVDHASGRSRRAATDPACGG